MPLPQQGHTLPSHPVLPFGRVSRQIGLVLDTVGGEIYVVASFWASFECARIFGRLVAITVDNAYASASLSASHIV